MGHILIGIALFGLLVAGPVWVYDGASLPDLPKYWSAGAVIVALIGAATIVLGSLIVGVLTALMELLP